MLIKKTVCVCGYVTFLLYNINTYLITQSSFSYALILTHTYTCDSYAMTQTFCVSHEFYAWITSTLHVHTQKQMCMYTDRNLALVLTHKSTQSQMAVSAVTLETSRRSIWKSGEVLYHCLSSGRDKLAVCQQMEEGNWFFNRVKRIWQLNFCTQMQPLHPVSINGTAIILH